MAGFAELGIMDRRVARLKQMGITEPTPVQAETIPVVLRGRDVISQAQTGTGKTLAFVLPMMEKIDPDKPEVQGLIVTPTRELALQITAEIKKLIEPEDGVRVLAVYGGQDVEAQLLKLKGNIHLIVATPGRLLDHLRRETVSLGRVRMLVLDEADQMLHMGFLEEVGEVLRQTPTSRQTMLFSATMPPKIREMAGQILRNPEHVTVKAEKVTVKEIRQWVVETTDRAKQATLVKLLEETKPYLAMIFCRTKRRASTLNEALQTMGYASDELHGDLSQAKREQVMKRFREAKLQLLVATDVAARGLDVEGVTHVFNYDVPLDVESYIHRIGRTGRAGESGLAISLIAPKDQRELADIEDGIGQVIERRDAEGKPMGGRNALQPRGGAAAGRGGRGGFGGGGDKRGGGYARGGDAAKPSYPRTGERKPAGKGRRGMAEAITEEDLRMAAHMAGGKPRSSDRAAAGARATKGSQERRPGGGPKGFGGGDKRGGSYGGNSRGGPSGSDSRGGGFGRPSGPRGGNHRSGNPRGGSTGGSPRSGSPSGGRSRPAPRGR